MKFSTSLTLLASGGYLATVLSFPLVDNSGGANSVNDGYVGATTINVPQGIPKRQNQQDLAFIMNFGIGDVVNDHKNEHRGQFTQDVTRTLWKNNPHYNYVICHVAHDYTFQGVRGVNWDHLETIGAEVSYDIIVGGAGTFIRHGDGGYINWAYTGNVASRIDFGRSVMVTFNATS